MLFKLLSLGGSLLHKNRKLKHHWLLCLYYFLFCFLFCLSFFYSSFEEYEIFLVPISEKWRKLTQEGQIFKGKSKGVYFLVEVMMYLNTVCLLKDCNVRHHLKINHCKKYDQYTRMSAETKRTLKRDWNFNRLFLNTDRIK